jgi:hypothetical protein
MSSPSSLGVLHEALMAEDESGAWSNVRKQFAVQARSPDCIEELLVSVCGLLNKDILPAGARPYVHVNGFTKFVLFELPKTCARLTFHYWPPKPSDTLEESRAHNHRFQFSSILLTGYQQLNEFSADMETEGESCEYEYWPYLGGRFARIRRRGTVQLRKVRNVLRSPLTHIYHLDETTVHTVETYAGVGSATLVLRGPRVRKLANVYYAKSGKPGRFLGVQLGRSVDADEMKDQLEHVLGVV